MIYVTLVLLTLFAGCGVGERPVETNVPGEEEGVAAESSSEASAAAEGTEESEELPMALDFTLQTPGGERVSLSDYRGSVVLVNFWASWCPPCNEEMPDLQSYYADHRDEGFVLIGVNVKENAEAATAFVETYDVTFPVVLDRDAGVAGTYGVTGLPASYFVDPEGRLMGFWPGVLTREKLEADLTPKLPGE
jgi:peroxiredoxin